MLLVEALDHTGVVYKNCGGRLILGARESIRVKRSSSTGLSLKSCSTLTGKLVDVRDRRLVLMSPVKVTAQGLDVVIRLGADRSPSYVESLLERLHRSGVKGGLLAQTPKPDCAPSRFGVSKVDELMVG